MPEHDAIVAYCPKPGCQTELTASQAIDLDAHKMGNQWRWSVRAVCSVCHTVFSLNYWETSEPPSR